MFESIKGELHLLTQFSAEIGVLLPIDAMKWVSEPNADNDSLAMLRMVSEMDAIQRLTESIGKGEDAVVRPDNQFDRQLTRMGFWYRSTNLFSPPMQMSCGSIPYWSIVVPLILLSAWLLLSKPRKPAATVNPVEVTRSCESSSVVGKGRSAS
ncbi:hypothetical protein [Schlesneria sp. T3-172]|uniref:hypothetical protein n=1 Tax=Schlesneria sphaerica TaxID=3373610 RepID=UPI0037C603F2